MTVIPFPARPPEEPAVLSRTDALQTIVDSLREFSDGLYWSTIELALSDALRAQAPTDPDASPPPLDPAVMADCGDPAVRELIELMGQIDHLVRVLK